MTLLNLLAYKLCRLCWQSLGPVGNEAVWHNLLQRRLPEGWLMRSKLLARFAGFAAGVTCLYLPVMQLSAAEAVPACLCTTDSLAACPPALVLLRSCPRADNSAGVLCGRGHRWGVLDLLAETSPVWPCDLLAKGGGSVGMIN
jgi:hypothetical protein